MIDLPLEQLIIGIFALFGAAVTGAFSVYNTKVSKKLTQVEKRTTENKTLTVGNDILEQIVPALERKDEALDKIAEILDNILRAQTLTSQQLKGVQLILENRCQALEVVKALQSLMNSKNIQTRLDGLKDEAAQDTTKNILDEIVERLSCDNNLDKRQKGGGI
jgi:myo-inositol-1-phosphate synthase